MVDSDQEIVTILSRLRGIVKNYLQNCLSEIKNKFNKFVLDITWDKYQINGQAQQLSEAFHILKQNFDPVINLIQLQTQVVKE